jgi:DNA excision repair protein ERCC-4
VNDRFQLPALRSLGEAGTEPVLVTDAREQLPLPFTRLKSVCGTLQTGDYSVVGLEQHFAVERKTISDLVGCCIGQNRERFERELHRLRGFRFKRLLIVGTEAEILKGDYRSNIKPAAVIGTLGAFESRYDLPVVFKASAELAADQVERWAWYFAREMVETVNSLWRERNRSFDSK